MPICTSTVQHAEIVSPPRKPDTNNNNRPISSDFKYSSCSSIFFPITNNVRALSIDDWARIAVRTLNPPTSVGAGCARRETKERWSSSFLAVISRFQQPRNPLGHTDFEIHGVGIFLRLKNAQEDFFYIEWLAKWDRLPQCIGATDTKATAAEKALRLKKLASDTANVDIEASIKKAEASRAQSEANAAAQRAVLAKAEARLKWAVLRKREAKAKCLSSSAQRWRRTGGTTTTCQASSGA